MRRSTCRLFALAFLLALTAQADPNSPSKADRDRAHELFVRSKKLDCIEAAKLLQEAWALHHSADIAANLGACQASMGKYADAANHLAFADRHLMASATKEQRDKVTTALTLVKKQVGEVVLSVTPDGADISIDGKFVGSAPLEGGVFVAPGDHKVAVRAEGHGGSERIVTATKGERQTVEIALVTTDTPAAGGASGGATGATGGTSATGAGAAGGGGDAGGPAEDERSLVPVYIAGSVAVVGLSAALGFEFGRSSNANDASTALDALGPNGCGVGSPNASVCMDIHDSNVAAHRNEGLRNVSLGVAGAAVVFGVGYLLWPRSSSESAGATSTWVSVAPIASNGANGVSVSGSF